MLKGVGILADSAVYTMRSGYQILPREESDICGHLPWLGDISVFFWGQFWLFFKFAPEGARPNKQVAGASAWPRLTLRT